MKKAFSYFVSLGLILTLFCDCGGSSADTKEDPVISETPNKRIRLLTHRYLSTDQSLFQNFSQSTGVGVEVSLLSSKDIAEGLTNLTLDRIDLVFLPGIEAAQKLISLQKIQPFLTEEIDNNVPNRFLDLQGYWVGLTRWTMGAAFRPGENINNELRTYADLIKPSLRGRLIMAHPDSSGFAFMVAGMVADKGEGPTRAYLKAIQANLATAPTGNDYELINQLVEQKADAAILSSSSFLRYRHSGNPEAFQNTSDLRISIPNDGRGTNYYDLSVACLPMNATNREEALSLLAYLTYRETQPIMAEAAMEYPVNSYAEISDYLLAIEGLPQGNSAPEDAENQLETARRIIRETFGI